MNINLEVGDTVTLSPNHCWIYNNANSIGIEGVVTEHKIGWVCVDWSNDTNNTYRDTDSDLIKVEVNKED
jgi:hypothetical protein